MKKSLAVKSQLFPHIMQSNFIPTSIQNQDNTSINHYSMLNFDNIYRYKGTLEITKGKKSLAILLLRNLQTLVKISFYKNLRMVGHKSKIAMFSKMDNFGCQ